MPRGRRILESILGRALTSGGRRLWRTWGAPAGSSGRCSCARGFGAADWRGWVSLQLLHVSGQLLPPEDDGQPHGPGRPVGGAAWEPAARSVDAAHPGVRRPVGVLLHRAAEVFDPKVVATPSGPATEPLDAHAVDELDRHLEF